MVLQLALIVSTVLHAGVLVWALVAIQKPNELRVTEPEPIVVAMITPDELTRVMLGDRKGQIEPTKAPEAQRPAPERKEPAKPKREPAAHAPPPPPTPATEPPRKDPIADLLKEPPPPPPVSQGPTDEEKKLLEAKLLADERQRRVEAEQAAEAERRAEEQRRAEAARKEAAQKEEAAAARKKAEERRKRLAEERKKREAAKRKEDEKRKKQFNPDEIAALLNKVPDKSAPPAATTKADPKATAKATSAGDAAGRDTRLTASELAVLAQIIRACVQSRWTVLAGGEQAQEVVIRMNLRFNADGSLAAPPTVLNPLSTAYFLAVADSAMRAVKECEPFNLPADKYESWKNINMTFNPRDMFR